MSLIVIDKFKKRYISFIDDIDINKRYFCCACKERMMFVNALLKIKHFRHYSKCPWEHEPESKEHLDMKKFFYDNYSNIKLEVPFNLNGIKRQADVYYEDKKIIIECQASKISSKEMINRIEDYNKLGIAVMFVFHKKLLADDFEEEQGISDFLLLASTIFYGRVYIFDGKSILSVRFSNVYRCCYTRYGEEYLKPYCKIKIPSFKYIDNHLRKIFVTLSVPLSGICEGEEFKIARFCDKVWWNND